MLATFIALFVVSLVAGISVSTWLVFVAGDRASKAEASDKKTKDALQSVQEEKEKTEETLARSLLRPLGHNSYGYVADPEIEALWELGCLSSGQDAPRLLFIELALQRPMTARQLRNRADLAVHAAVGLDPATRRGRELFA